MGLMDLFNQGDIREKLYAAANRNNVPQGGVTGAAFNALFPHGLGNLAFGREPQANPDLASPEGTQYMADLASNMMVPGTFIGPKGMSNLLGDDVARGLMSGAEAKLAQGVPREEVFRELGVFKGPEGKWRYEIDDSGMGFNPSVSDSWGIATPQGDAAARLKEATELIAEGWPESKVHKLTGYARIGGEGELIDFRPNQTPRMVEHAGLERAYGPMNGLNLQVMPNDGRIGGIYDDVKNKIKVAGGRPSEAMRSDTLHELQHAVQGREDFARGGSPQGMMDEYANARARLHYLESDPDFIAGKRKLDKIWDDVFEGKITEDDASRLEAEIIKQHPAHQQAQDAMQTMRMNPAQTEADAYSAYHRLAGEAESREVQKRMNMGMSQRRSIFPEYAGRDDLIVRGLMGGR